MHYSFHPHAQQELEEASAYYASLNKKLGEDFVEEVANAITRITSFPEAWPRLSANTRRCRVNRFPYGLIYTRTASEVLIVAVMHLHREPNYWADRIE